MYQHDYVLKKIENEADNERWPIIGPQKGQVLVEAVRKFQPKRVLEVGTLVGYSTILMSQYLPQKAKIIAVEIDPQIARLARNNFSAAGISGRVELEIGDAREVIERLAGPFDLVFLDAAKEQYLQYLQSVEEKLSPNAVIVADNVKIFADTLSDYLQYVRRRGPYESETYDFGFDAVEVSRKKPPAVRKEKLAVNS